LKNGTFETGTRNTEKTQENIRRLNLVELRKELNALLEKLEESVSGKKKEKFTDILK